MIGSILNKVVPFNIALQALEKVSPKLKSFISGAAAAGYGSSEILDFLRSEYTNQNESKENLRPDQEAAINRRATEERGEKNIRRAATLAGGLAGGLGASALTKGISDAAPAAISAVTSGESDQGDQPADPTNPQSPFQKSPSPIAPDEKTQPQPINMASKLIAQFPQLGKFLDEQIAQGVNPVEAAANARKNRLLSPVISKIEGDIDESFEDLIGRLYAPNQPSFDKQNSPLSELSVALNAYNKMRSGGK